VFLVKSLGYNLLSVSQLCHMDYNSLCTNIDVSVFRRSEGSLALVVIPSLLVDGFPHYLKPKCGGL
jgi:hypothetical protein